MSQVTAPELSPTAQQPAEAQPNGAAVAVCLAAMLSMLALAASIYFVETGEAAKSSMIAIALWVPGFGSTAKGPFPGEEVLMAYVWLGSWAVLHFLLRRKHFSGGGWLWATLIGVGIATLAIWPPVYHFVYGKP